MRACARHLASFTVRMLTRLSTPAEKYTIHTLRMCQICRHFDAKQSYNSWPCMFPDVHLPAVA